MQQIEEKINTKANTEPQQLTTDDTTDTSLHIQKRKSQQRIDDHPPAKKSKSGKRSKKLAHTIRNKAFPDDSEPHEEDRGSGDDEEHIPPQPHNSNRKKTQKNKIEKYQEEPDVSTDSSESVDDEDRQFTRRKRRRQDYTGEHYSFYNTTTDSDSDTSDELADKPTLFGSIIGSSVNTKLRQKIISDKFVEMSDLLPQYYMQDSEEYVMQFKTKATFVKNKPRKTLNFNQWIEAFDIYTSIYIERATSVHDSTKILRALLTYRKELTNMKKLQYN